MRAQITDAVREMVLSRAIQDGSRLPSTQALAEQWKVKVPTVHDALTPLVKEGLLERTPRIGTFVRRREERLARVGIYLSSDHIWRASAFVFGRTLCKELHEQLGRLDIEDSLWVDPRPEAEQATPWAELARAAAERRFQALIVPSVDLAHIPWLDKLPVPVVFLSTHPPLPNRVDFDDRDWAETALSLLREQGCRSVGVISAKKVHLSANGEPIEGHTGFYRQLSAAAVRLGLDLRPEWVMHAPPEGFHENGAAFKQFGYAAMTRLWACPERPDGIAVYEDVTAAGAIMATMQARIAVPDELKLALHSNAEIGLFCPFPAAFIDVCVTEVAAALIAQTRRLYAGEEVGAVIVPHRAAAVSTGAGTDVDALPAPRSELEYAVMA